MHFTMNFLDNSKEQTKEPHSSIPKGQPSYAEVLGVLHRTAQQKAASLGTTKELEQNYTGLEEAQQERLNEKEELENCSNEFLSFSFSIEAPIDVRISKGPYSGFSLFAEGAGLDKNDSASAKTDSNTFISILRYVAGEAVTKIDSTVKMQVYGPESPGTITDDGIRCKHGNISLYGKKSSCLKIMHELGKEFEFSQRVKFLIPVCLETVNDKRSELKSLEEQITNEFDVELMFVDAVLPHDSNAVAVNAHYEVSGKQSVVSRAIPVIQCKLDALKGFHYECISLDANKALVSLIGPQKKHLLNFELEHNVRVVFDSNCLVSSTPHDSICLYISGCKENVLKAKSAFVQEEHSKRNQLASKSWSVDKIKLDFLLINEFAQLKRISYQYGVAIDLHHPVKQTDSEGSIFVYGGQQWLIKEASEAICQLIHEYQFCTLTLENSPEMLQFTVEDFDAFESLSAKLRIISQRTKSHISVQSGEIVVAGKEENVSSALEYLKKLKIVQNHLVSCKYEIEKSSEIKEFICGKKDGKINKIMKETGVEIELVGKNENFLKISLFCSSLSEIPQAISMLNGELPAEISFYIPEFHHKRIIGHGGKNIQRIMKKYGVYIKFLNLDESIAKNGHPSYTGLGNVTKFLPNVVVKTPFKNKDVLSDMKDEVLLEANESEVMLMADSAVLPLGEETFFNQKSCDNIRKIFKECSVDYFLDEDGKGLHLVGLQDSVGYAKQKISYVLPVECISLQPVAFNNIKFKYLDKSKCFYSCLTLDDNGSYQALPKEIKLISSFKSKSVENQNLQSDKKNVHSNRDKYGFNECFDSFVFSELPQAYTELGKSVLSSELIENSTSCKIPPPGLIGCQKKSNTDFDFNSILWSNSLLESKISNSNLISDIIPIRSIDQTQTLEALLESLELSKYLDLFKKHEIDFKGLCMLSDDDLKEVGIYALGSRKKILNAMQSYKNSSRQEEPSNNFLQPRSALNGNQSFAQEKKHMFNLFMPNCIGPNDIPYGSIFNCNEFSSVLF